MNLSDTIVAVSSPPGRGQRSLVRLSGPAAFVITGLEGAPRGCRPVRIEIDGGSLPALAVIAPGPGSYTGEDVVEYLIPGGELLERRVREALVRSAGRAGLPLRDAEAGEFTARAYFNGRIDLLAAEGVAEAIRAETDSQLRAAGLMRGGSLASIARTLVDHLTRLTALVEAGIDFTDQEDVVAIPVPELASELDGAITELVGCLEGATSAERLDSVPLVVLAGPANAGKSSLFNALLGTERTVVADLEGTTRDVVIEPLRLESADGDLEILLADLAGFDAGEEDRPEIEQAMQRRTREAIERADLVLRCTSIGETPIGLSGDSPLLEVVTRSDLGSPADSDLAVSSRTGSGLDALRERITGHFTGTSNVLGEGVLALSRRHRSALEETLEAMRRARELLDDGGGAAVPAELVAACLRDALDALGGLVGRITPDQVLEHVFARFCVGK